MSEIVNDELIEDAEIEGLSGRSRFGGFLRGMLLGVLAAGGVLLGLTLSHPLPGNLPGIGEVQVDAGTQVEQQQVATIPQTGNAEATAVANSDASQTPATGVSQQASSEVAASATAQTEEPASQTTSQEVSNSIAATTADTEQSAPNPPASGSASTNTEDTDAAVTPQLPASEPSEEDTATTELAAVTPAPETTVPAEPALPEINLPGPAFNVNASTFEVPDNAPILAIILEDAANGSVQADSLGLWPFPVALGIAPESPDAVTLSKAARAANHEVLIQMPFAENDDDTRETVLRAGLEPEALQALTLRNLASLPDAMGVVGPSNSSLLSDEPAMTAIIAQLQEHGFAWVDPAAGSGSVVGTIASGSDLIHGVSNRVVPAGASTQQVLNGLKSAAFAARQRGTAIIRVAASAETMPALLSFALENGDNTFRIVPVSAVLNRRAASR